MGDSVMYNETFNFMLEGSRYLANFDYTPSRNVDNQQLFRGILGGQGEYIDHDCIVRTNTKGTKESWGKYLEVRERLQAIEKIFRANNINSFRVPKSGLVSMDTVSVLSKIASALKGSRPPRKDEWVLVDLYRSPRKEFPCTGPLFSAISHVSLKLSHGRSYLTNFRAFEYNGNMICITNADTSTDLAAFENLHECTDLCRVEIPSNRPKLPPLVGLDNFTSHPADTPMCEMHFPKPPPYSRYPPATAPPIESEQFTFSYPFPRSFSSPTDHK